MCLNRLTIRKKIQILTVSGSLKLATTSLILRKDKGLGLKQVHVHRLKDEPINIKTSSNGETVIVSLMDFSLKILHADTLKEKLKIYGHSLPITDFAVSTDEYVLATVSNDKSLRIWDKDFGNCRRIINKCHDVAPTCIRILKETHYALTVGRDCFIKFWDLDSFQLVMRFEFLSENWLTALTVSSYGHFFIVGGKGRNLRKFRQTKEQRFAADTKEQLEDEKGVLTEFEDRERMQAYFASGEKGKGESEAKHTRANRLKRFEVLKVAEEIMELLDTVNKDCLSTFSEFENKILDQMKNPALLGKRGNAKFIYLHDVDSLRFDNKTIYNCLYRLSNQTSINS